MYPVFSANRAGSGGINSIPPPIRPPLLPNVFNEVEEEDESASSFAEVERLLLLVLILEPKAKSLEPRAGFLQSALLVAGLHPPARFSSVPFCVGSVLCGKDSGLIPAQPGRAAFALGRRVQRGKSVLSQLCRATKDLVPRQISAEFSTTCAAQESFDAFL